MPLPCVYASLGFTTLHWRVATSCSHKHFTQNHRFAQALFACRHILRPLMHTSFPSTCTCRSLARTPLYHWDVHSSLRRHMFSSTGHAHAFHTRWHVLASCQALPLSVCICLHVQCACTTCNAHVNACMRACVSQEIKRRRRSVLKLVLPSTAICVNSP